MQKRRQPLLDTFLCDVNGNRVIGQKPNAPQVVGITALLTSWPLPGRLGHVAAMLAYGALFTWAWLEMFQGASYIRRLFGIVVLTGLVLAIA